MRRKMVCLAASLWVLGLSGVSSAAVREWTGGASTNYFDPNNWFDGSLPSLITFDGAKMSYAGWPGPHHPTLVNGTSSFWWAEITNNLELTIGANGQFNANGDFDMAIEPGSTGTLTMVDNGYASAGTNKYIKAGWSGDAFINMSGDSLIEAPGLVLGTWDDDTSPGACFMTMSENASVVLSFGWIDTFRIKGNIGGNPSHLSIFDNATITILNVDATGYIQTKHIDTGLLDGKVKFEGGHTIIFNEIALDQAREPSPGEGEVIGDFTPVLSWTTAPGADSHDVYFGDDFDQVNNATNPSVPPGRGNQSGTFYDTADHAPAGLEVGRRYYWRIDEIFGTETIKGNIWQFVVADFDTVEDFESYSDPNVPLPTWLPTGGASIQLAEQTFPWNNNMLSYAYDSSSSPFFSEIVRTYVEPQDWTIAGLRALDLRIKGSSGNTGEPVYVVLEDAAAQTAGVTHTSLDLTNENWQFWQIDLQDFAGVDLANIKKVYLGFGDRDNPSAGGSGAVFIDDLRLYPVRVVDRGPRWPDLSGDFLINLPDFSLLANEWMAMDIFGGELPANLNGDSAIDNQDLTLMAGDWLDTRMTQHIDTAVAVGLENTLVRVAFSKTTGAMVSLKNLVTDDEYLKNTVLGGNPFRVYVDPTGFPGIAEAPYPSFVNLMDAGDTLGATVVDPGDCTYQSSTYQRVGNKGMLTIEMTSSNPNMTFELTVALADGDELADFDLAMTNNSGATHEIMVAMPFLTGLGLGSDVNSVLAVSMAGAGIPGVDGWPSGVTQADQYGGVYARQINMQWQSVYEPSLKEGLGVLVKDGSLEDKIIHRFAPSGLSTLYFKKRTLAPAQQVGYPTAALMVNSGTWRPVARRYGEWFRSTFTLEEPKDWYYDIDRSGGGPIVPAAMPIEEMPIWDLHTTGMPEYTHWDADHPDGFTVDPILGTSAEFRAGMDILHEQGRRMMIYILGASRSVNSSIYAPDIVDDWAMWVNTNGNYMFLSVDHILMCWGSPQFQTYLSEGCKTALIETGADGIRLDQAGSAFSPCFNPAHNHATPFDGNLWRDQMLSKVRAKMDEVNPDAVLYTENLWDAVHKYCDGALALHTSGFDQSPMALIIPNYRIRAHHAGQAEAALNGWITSGTHAVRQDHGWLWMNEPAFLNPPGPSMKWQLIRPTFIDTLKDPDVTEVDPLAPDDAQWIGRMWKADDYWLMVGGHFDASPLNGPTLVKLPDALPGEIRHAYEIDLLGVNTDVGIDDIDPRILFRSDSGIFVIVKRPFSALLLPKPDCRPLVLVEGAIPDLVNGDQNESISLVPFAPWGGTMDPNVTVTTYGFDVAATHPNYGATATMTLPATAVLSIPADIPIQTGSPGLSLYKMTVTSNECLPLELWLEVHN